MSRNLRLELKLRARLMSREARDIGQLVGLTCACGVANRARTMENVSLRMPRTYRTSIKIFEYFARVNDIYIFIYALQLQCSFHLVTFGTPCYVNHCVRAPCMV